MNVRDSISQARIAIKLNMRQCCVELLEMNSTSILVDGQIRRIIKIITDNTEYDISYHDASAIVFSAVHEQAMMECVFLLKD